MKDLVLNQNANVRVITLKEITDLIEVRHNDAMRKVEELAKEPDFGTLRKTRIVYNDKGQEIDTYIFDKIQAIAVGARLNNTLLMKVIKRLEELENQNKYQVPQTFHEALLLAADLEKQNETLKLQNQKQNQFITTIVHNENSYTATQVAKELGISAKLFNKILVEADIMYKNNGTYVLTSKYQNYKLTELKETTPNDGGKTFLSLRWTAIGKNWIMNNFVKALHKCSEDSFNKYNQEILSNLPKIPESRVKRF